MKLSARTRYAARLLLDLALHEENKPRKASQLSESTDVSVQFIEQIFKPLKQAGFIRSVRGANGGHLLNAAPETITLGGIYRAMEGSFTLADCCDDPKSCERATDCPTRSAWARISDALEKEMDAITLEELMHNPEGLID
ncbi:RrF2 family transcriptional regulator [Desulfovibrio ferrophilus]|uniref:BadM/Rrf2 family transcriptional regulator n=1 Tax=Desulfovibrio ferrophilus TaxID=241368 RepID=A0A2Z6AU21_9BACT|nr:Rrf2 family transcriptional regulator [Desulfovibrio ferrophilus]BBD06737.1 BadM/Rrf2 family transcriptional regulator [Desulfovibrio ferrophilus]